MLMVTLVGMAAAHPANAAPAAVTGIRITAQSSFVAPNGSFVVEVAVDGSTDGPGGEASGLELAVSVFDRLEDEAEIDEPPSGTANRLQPVAISELVANDNGRYQLEIPVRAGEPFDELPRLLLADAGVYPITVELRSADGVVATTRSNLIRLPPNANENADEVPISVVLPVAPAEGITVVDAQKLLSNHPDLPITVLLDDGVIAQLQEDRALTEALVEALGERPLVARPAIDLDPSALAAIDRIGLYEDAVADTNSQLSELGFTPDQSIAAVDHRLTAVGAQALVNMGVRVVLDASAGQASNGYLNTVGGRLHLLRYDRAISQVFNTTATGVIQSNEALARIVVRGQTNRSPIVIGGAALGPRPTRGLNVFFHALARGGAPEPMLVPAVTTSTFEQRPAEHPTQDLEPVTEMIAEAQSLLSSYTAMYTGVSTGGSSEEQAGSGTTPDDYQRQLQSALSLSRNPQDRLRSLELLNDGLVQELAAISLPDAQPVTMAAREGSIPLIVDSRASGPRLVMLRFRSDKVNVKQDQQLVVVEPGVSSIDVEVEARSLGASQLVVSIWTADGERVLATNQFEVRSTAVPGLGLLISMAALVFLILWWYVDYRRASSKRIEQRAATIIGDSPSGPSHPATKQPGQAEQLVRR